MHSIVKPLSAASLLVACIAGAIPAITGNESVGASQATQGGGQQFDLAQQLAAGNCGR